MCDVTDERQLPAEPQAHSAMWADQVGRAGDVRVPVPAETVVEFETIRDAPAIPVAMEIAEQNPTQLILTATPTRITCRKLWLQTMVAAIR